MQKITTISVRLKNYMERFHLRQVDIVEMVKPYAEEQNIVITKASISQYVIGHTEPNDIRLKALSLALGVNELWLRGYDVNENGEPLSPEEIEDQLKPVPGRNVSYQSGLQYSNSYSDVFQPEPDDRKRLRIMSKLGDLDSFDLDTLDMIVDRMRGRCSE